MTKSLLNNTGQGGYVALTSVLLVSAVVLAISITVSMLAISDGQSTLSGLKGEESLHFTEGCIEDALLTLRTKPSYSGGSTTRPEGTCNITVVQGGINYTVTASGTDNIYNKTISVVVTRTSFLELQSWRID